MKQKRGSLIRGLLVSVVVFALLAGALVWLMNTLRDTSDEEQLTLVRDSIHNALLTCYAVEGAYPESLDYLVDNYGLMYDEETIAVYYDAFASNIMPEVRVSVRGDGLP